MQTIIGTYNAETLAVPVTFVDQGVTHERHVNAVVTDGQYDPDETAERVADVARGVAVKIGLGVIIDAPPPDE